MKCWDKQLGEILGFAAALRSVVGGDCLHGAPLSETVGIGPPNLMLRGGSLLVNRRYRIVALLGLVWHLAWPQGARRKFRHPRESDLRKLEGRVLIEVVSVQDRVRALWEPLARAYGPKGCLLLVPNEQIRNQLPPEYAVVIFSEIPGDLLWTRIWVLRRVGRWLRQLRGVCKEFTFAESARWRIAGFLAGQAAHLSQAVRLGRLLKPKVLIVGSDLVGSGAVLCAAMKTCGIPSVTLVHGAFGRQNAPLYTPLQADFVGVWGEMQAGLFAKAGVAEDRIWKCGLFRNRSHRCRQTDGRRGSLLKKIELLEEKLVVVVGLTCLTASARMAWGDLLGLISRGLAGVCIVARLHPSNSMSDFSESAGLDPTENLQFVDDSMISAKDSLELADAVVVDSSAFGMDAIEHGVPVVVISPPCGSDYLGPMLEATEAGAARYAKDAEQAVEALRTLLFERNARESLKHKAETFLERYYCAYGDDAIARFKQSLAMVVAGGSKGIASIRTNRGHVPK